MRARLWSIGEVDQVGDPEGTFFCEQAQEVALTLRERRDRYGMGFLMLSAGIGYLLGGFVPQADGHHCSAVEVIFYSDVPMGEVQIFLYDRQAGTHSSYVFLHRFDRRGEARQLGLLFMGNPRALIGEADGVSVVEDGNHDLGEPRMNEVFGHLPDHRVGNGTPAALRVVERRGSQCFDVFVGRSRWNFDDAWSAAQIVVHGYARRRFHIGEIERCAFLSCAFRRFG